MMARKFVLAKRINGKPELSDFQLVEESLPELADGGITFNFRFMISHFENLLEILVKAEWLSMDPFIRIALSSIEIGQTIPGAQVARYDSYRTNVEAWNM
jgi:prostaglandin reductase 1